MASTEKKPAVRQASRHSSTNAGTPLVLALAASLAGLWLWKRQQDGKGASAGGGGGPRTAGSSSSSSQQQQQQRKPGNAKKDKSRSKDKKAAREAKRNEHLESADSRAGAPEERNVVKDEKRGIDGDALYLNHGYFRGSVKKK